METDLIASFPPPPLYYKEFKLSDDSVAPEKVFHPPDIPSNTREFVCFGEPHNLVDTVNPEASADFGIKMRHQLDIVTRTYLDIIAAATQGNFTAMADLLPQIKTAFVEMHMLINEQRKIEALTRTIGLLRERIRKKEELIKQIDENIRYALSDALEPFRSIESELLKSRQFGPFTALIKEMVQCSN